MLLHEFGHIAKQHPLIETSRAKLEENEADRFATRHVLEGVSDSSVLMKRNIGIAVANVLLAILDILPETASSNAYPPAEERLSRNLRENQLSESHPVHAFTTALLQVHPQRFGVPHDLNDNETFASLVNDFCVALNRHGKSCAQR
jgi:hypothetical protein